MKLFIRASFFQKIVLPAMLAILLFVISVFAFIIPSYERSAIMQKRNMLSELTSTAWSILNKYHNDEVKGLITLKEAQKQAISEVEALRYGSDKKDYFWITDLTPVMIMHPYVHELTGKSLQDYADPDGKRLFIEALKIAEESGEGFINYKWQFMDDSTHIVPKLSFVKKFTPWSWIIGTGIYLDDVQEEISALTGKLILILLGITFIITLIIIFITYQSLTIENKRREAEVQLRESREKYKSLLESSTEGIILLVNNKVSYSNAFIQNWLKYTAEELIQLDIKKIFPAGHNPDLNKIDKETRMEIGLIRKDSTLTETLLTLLPVRFAEKEGILMTFRDTSEHRSVKTELEELKTRLHQISDLSGKGIFRFLLTGKIQLIECNNKLVSILGYENAAEIENKSIREILSGNTDIKEILKELKKKNAFSDRVLLRRKDNTYTEVKMRLLLTEESSGGNIYCDGIVEPVEEVVISDDHHYFTHYLAASIQLRNQTANDYCLPAVFCSGEVRIEDAIGIMVQNDSDFVLLMLNKICIGIITRRDIITRYLFENKSEASPATDFMTAPVIYVDSNASIGETAGIFETKKVSHLIVRNKEGEIAGVIDKSSIFKTCLNSAGVISQGIKNSRSLNDLYQFRLKLPLFIGPLLDEVGHTQTFNSIISKLNDEITIRIIQNAIKEYGQPPVPFAFISYGSAGREELVFNSDQDNAIIYSESAEISPSALHDYFTTLGLRVCKDLDESGLALCKGGYMAGNPMWCQPLSKWKDYFTTWIINPEPQNILNISVFFDFRFIFGDNTIFEELEDYVFSILEGRSAFYYFLAQSVTGFKPPIGVFGNILTETTKTKDEVLDLKNCMSPIVMFARIYALYNNIRYKGTIDRIRALSTKGILSRPTVDEVLFHYNYLMYHRMKQQLRDISNKNEVSNNILPKKLTEMEQMILKKIFSQMNTYQEKLSAEFMSSWKG